MYVTGNFIVLICQGFGIFSVLKTNIFMHIHENVPRVKVKLFHPIDQRHTICTLNPF